MTRWNDQESTGSGAFLLGAVAGALVGAGIALLMAPKSGAQVRQDLSTGYNSVRDAASRRYRDLADKATQKFDEAASRLEQKFEQKVDEYSGRNSSTVSDTTSPSGFPRA